MKKRNLLVAPLLGILVWVAAGAPAGAQTGSQTDWLLPMGARVDSPRAVVNDPMYYPTGEIANAVGVQAGASDGYGGPDEDKPHLLVGGPIMAVTFSILHQLRETGWETAPSSVGYYAARWDVRAPLSPGQSKDWSPIYVQGIAGDIFNPVPIVVEWDTSRVPSYISLKLQWNDAGVGGEVDMRTTQTYTFPAYGPFQRVFHVVATDTRAVTVPTVILVPSTTTVQAGRYTDIQAIVTGGDPNTLVWSLSPQPPAAGTIAPSGAMCRYTAPSTPPAGPVTLTATLPGGVASARCTITVTSTPVLGPTITSFDPKHGVPGTVVLIYGSNFASTPGGNLVRFNGGAQAAVQAVTAARDKLQVIVPQGAQTGLFTVETSAGVATSPQPFVVDQPADTKTRTVLAQPNVGAVGSHIKLSVLYGGQVTSLPPFPVFYFNGRQADNVAQGVPVVPTDTYLLKRVPQGAITGPVTMFDGSTFIASDVPFTVLQPPTVDGMRTDQDTNDPKKQHHARPGESVTITGTNFLASNVGLAGYVENGQTLVRFNGMTDFVPVTLAYDTELVVVVPPQASRGPSPSAPSSRTRTPTGCWDRTSWARQ